MRAFKNIIKCISSIFLTLLVLISFYTLLSTGVFKKPYVNIFGYTYFVIASGSMSPAIEVNDIIVVRLDDAYDVDDIVTYKSGDSFVTHRVVGIESDKITTKGDANNVEDTIVETKDVIGRVSVIVSSQTLLKVLGSIILVFVLISIINFDDIFKKYITKEKKQDKKKESPIEYTQVIPIVNDDKEIIDDILSKTTVINSIDLKNGEKVVNLKLKLKDGEKPQTVLKDADKKIIKDVLKVLEVNSNNSKITTDGALKLKYMYELCNLVLIDPDEVKSKIENIPFKELYDYDFEDVGFTKKVQDRLYEMPIYVYLIIMIYAIVYDNEFYFDAVYKVLKYRLIIEKDNDFVLDNYKVEKCVDFIEKVVSKCENKKDFDLDKIIEVIKANKELKK